uniref:Uncharacterized protein n=1 Tax=Arundo donax TaxID=35708 RepID=A0A0A9T530_ARUDO
MGGQLQTWKRPFGKLKVEGCHS